MGHVQITENDSSGMSESGFGASDVGGDTHSQLRLICV